LRHLAGTLPRGDLIMTSTSRTRRWFAATGDGSGRGSLRGCMPGAPPYIPSPLHFEPGLPRRVARPWRRGQVREHRPPRHRIAGVFHACWALHVPSQRGKLACGASVCRLPTTFATRVRGATLGETRARCGPRIACIALGTRRKICGIARRRRRCAAPDVPAANDFVAAITIGARPAGGLSRARTVRTRGLTLCHIQPASRTAARSFCADVTP